MWGGKAELDDLKARVEKLESQMGHLLRSLGIESGGPPDWHPSPKVLELLAGGKKIEAIKAFRAESGAGLKEAKAFVESLEGKRAG